MSYDDGEAALRPVQMQDAGDGSPVAMTHVRQASPASNDGAIDQDTANCSFASKLALLKFKGLVKPAVTAGEVLAYFYEGGRDTDVVKPDAIVQGRLSYKRASPEAHANAQAGDTSELLPPPRGFTGAGLSHWSIGPQRSADTVVSRAADGSITDYSFRPVYQHDGPDTAPKLHGWVWTFEYSAWRFTPEFRSGTGMSHAVARSILVAGQRDKDLRTLLEALALGRFTTKRYTPGTQHRIRHVAKPKVGEHYLVTDSVHWWVSQYGGADGKSVNHDPLDAGPRPTAAATGLKYYTITP